MNTETILAYLRMTKRGLTRLQSSFPNEDSYVTVHCLFSDLIKQVDYVLKDIKPSIKEAKELSRKKKKNGNVSST